MSKINIGLVSIGKSNGMVTVSGVGNKKPLLSVSAESDSAMELVGKWVSMVGMYEAMYRANAFGYSPGTTFWLTNSGLSICRPGVELTDEAAVKVGEIPERVDSIVDISEDGTEELEIV